MFVGSIMSRFLPGPLYLCCLYIKDPSGSLGQSWSVVSSLTFLQLCAMSSSQGENNTDKTV